MLERIRSNACLHVHYVATRPWSYVQGGQAAGHDIQACRRFADLLRVTALFRERRYEQLGPDLVAGRCDMAVGGLTRIDAAGIACLSARHAFGDADGGSHPSFYPNVWWIGDTDRLWMLRLVDFLAMQRIAGSPLDHVDNEAARVSPSEAGTPSRRSGNDRMRRWL